MFSPSLGRGIGGAAADLEAWTPVPRPTPTTPALSSGSGSGAGSGSGLSRDAQRENENERRKEQRDWLDLALATYVALGRAKEAEEVVRSEMVKAWCEKVGNCLLAVMREPWALQNGRSLPKRALRTDKAPAAHILQTIHSSTLNPMMHSPVTPRTPANAWGPSVQSSPASKERGDETKPDMNLPTHGHDTERLEPLQELYHRILLFASHDIAQVCAAAETASKTALPGSALSSSPSHSPSNSRAALPSSITGTTGTQDVKDVVPRGHGIDGVQAPCDIFVNVLWDEVGRKLMDELGGTIFFVGRTEVFHKVN